MPTVEVTMRRSILLALLLLVLPPDVAFAQRTFPGGTPTASGSGTANTLMKFDSAGNAADSLLSDDGTNVTLASGQVILESTVGIAKSSSGVAKITDASTGYGGLQSSGWSNVGSSQKGIGLGTASPSAYNQIQSAGALLLQTGAGDNVTFQSAANGASMGWGRLTTTVNAAAGATISATNLIPAGVVVYFVTTRITTGFGVTGGLASIDIGDGTTANLFANDSAISAGETTDLTDHAAAFAPKLYTTATSVVVTANGGTFDTTGQIRITVFYYSSGAPTS